MQIMPTFQNHIAGFFWAPNALRGLKKPKRSGHLAPKNTRNLNKKIVEVAQALRIQAQYSIMQWVIRFFQEKKKNSYNNGVTKPWVNGVKSDKIGGFQWRKSGRQKACKLFICKLLWLWTIEDSNFWPLQCKYHAEAICYWYKRSYWHIKTFA